MRKINLKTPSSSLASHLPLSAEDSANLGRTVIIEILRRSELNSSTEMEGVKTNQMGYTSLRIISHRKFWESQGLASMSGAPAQGTGGLVYTEVFEICPQKH